MKTLDVRDLGLIGYPEAFALQQELVAHRIAEQIPDTLLLLEHPPVITMGKSAADEDILVEPSVLEAAGATVHRINRGGEATYHGPGQLVGYAIIHLYEKERALRSFIRNLEEVFIRVLSVYGIDAGRDDAHRGVWVRDEKITAIGIAVSHRVTMHGFAFNVSTDLSHFRWIVPCGIRDRGQTSLERLLGRSVPMVEAKKAVTTAFIDVFGYTST